MIEAQCYVSKNCIYQTGTGQHCAPPILSSDSCKNLSLYHNEVVGGVYWFHSVRPSVRPSRMPCPLCIIYNYGWILFILGTNDHYHERVCRAP